MAFNTEDGINKNTYVFWDFFDKSLQGILNFFL